MLSYFDVVLIVVAAPIMLLIGVPATGYAVGAGAWIILRLLGVAVERYASATPQLHRAVSIRLGYMLGRLFTLAIAVILVTNADGKNSGLTCLAVFVFAFSAYLATSALTRITTPRASSRERT